MSVRMLRYPLELKDEQTLRLPEGANPLHVAISRSELCIWALVDISKTPTRRTFRIAGTNHEIADVADKRYIGTVHTGAFVWHVFECLDPLRVGAQEIGCQP